VITIQPQKARLEDRTHASLKRYVDVVTG